MYKNFDNVIKHPSPEAYASPSPSRGEGRTGRSMIGKLIILAVISLFSSSAEAKICFLPDGSCGTSKTTGFKQNPNGSGCMYKSDAEARNGLGACETTYKQNMCYYRRCKNKNEDSTVFSSYEDCKKSLDDKHECTSCGSCYKLVEKSDNTPSKKTCAKTENDCISGVQVFEADGTYDSDNVPCGICKTIETCTGDYSTKYQSQSDCKTGETFSSNGTANGKVCGKCEYIEQNCKSGYTAGLTNCSERRGYDASYTSDGYVGGKICGKCEYTAKTCPSGYDTKYSSASTCGNTGSEGWNYSTDGYSGEAVCGKCEAKTSCAAGYDTFYSSVGMCWNYKDENGNTIYYAYPTQYGESAWIYSIKGYKGNEACGKCTPASCPANTLKVDDLSTNNCGSKGYNGWTSERVAMSGRQNCLQCTPKACPSDYSITDVSQCPKRVWSSGTYSPYLEASKYSFHGEQPCYKCAYRGCADGYESCHGGKLCCKK